MNVRVACADRAARSGGVCILIRSERWGELRPKFELLGPSIGRAIIHMARRRLHVFGVYLPGGWSNYKNNETKELLSDALSAVPLGEPRVVIGDFNSHMGSMVPTGLHWSQEQRALIDERDANQPEEEPPPLFGILRKTEYI
eukprot:Cvel_11324.t1-p1 / transcript=Cvel_11324.t1 / gene=Cvel_11324 / organism=Chromera_velia_CCMP2878 / gene_product=hypothetical protein / transcript_product=hypothetical protein / location=Cvel_scaffold708:65414-65838(+) / protein_length=141 / sequence_SO=supercontig / SO=protein_coding / is_pseudo=false